MQDNRKRVQGRRTDDQTTPRKMEKSQNKRLARRTMAERSLATSHPPLDFLPELFKFF
jgi:hypothetical protein